MRRPSIASGRSSPKYVRTVGATSTRFTKPSCCVVVERSSPGSMPGARNAATLSAARSCGGVGPMTTTMSRVVDVLEQPADDAVGVLERAGAHLDRLLVGRELRLDVGPHEVGALDQHDRAGLPRVCEGALHPIGIEAHAERRGGVLAQQAVVDAAAGDLARAGHQRGDGRSPPRRRTGVGRARIGAVAVGDDGARDARRGELVTEQTGLGAVELFVVRLDGVGDRHVHETVAGGETGAGGEHDTGVVATEVLVDAEALVAGGAVADGTRAGAHGDVAARQRASGGRRRW